MTGPLTEAQRAEAQAILDQVIAYTWSKARLRMLLYGENTETAILRVVTADEGRELDE